jgi:hypothetical protein
VNKDQYGRNLETIDGSRTQKMNGNLKDRKRIKDGTQIQPEREEEKSTGKV